MPGGSETRALLSPSNMYMDVKLPSSAVTVCGMLSRLRHCAAVSAAMTMAG